MFMRCSIAATAAFYIALSTNKDALAFTNKLQLNQPSFAAKINKWRNTILHSTETSTSSITLDNKPIRGPITPLGNFVLVRVMDTLCATDGGILLPDQAQERPSEGEVVCAGPGRVHPQTGVRMTHPIVEGVRVLHSKFAGSSFIYNDEELTLLRDDDILLYYSGSVQMTVDNVIPLRDYVLVAMAAAKMETASGIAIAGSVTRNDVPCEGTVVKFGDGRMNNDGSVTKIPLSVGDEIKFKDFSGNELKIQGKDFCLVKMEDVLCCIEA